MKMNSSTSTFQSDYKRYTLNRYTTSPNITQYIENCAINEVIEASHSFHKIMVHSWSDDIEQLFNTVSEYYESSLIPVNASIVANMASFYTSNINLILKIIKLDFMMPYARNMFNITVLFNEKTSVDLLGRQMTLEDIVSRVVNERFNQYQELDLSSFSNDKEFLEWKVNFYKLALLSHFKTLMLRMGKETKSLNLSKNKLSKVPLEILNFFIKGDLTSVNLSDNEIRSLSDLSRVSSKIEKLWIEGNPLCDNVEASVYVKNIIAKFPRLIELDGIKLNEFGIVPVRRNYLVSPDRCTKLVVERFLIMFFSLYDNKKLYKKTSLLYDDNAVFSLMTDFTEAEERNVGKYYAKHSRNILDPVKRNLTKRDINLFNKTNLISILGSMPTTVHDPHTFTVDVLQHDLQSLVLVVDGIYKEIASDKRREMFFKFRRTFVLAIYPETDNRVYSIMNDMLYVGLASHQQIRKSFKYPIINFNSLALIDPNREEIDALVKVFMNVTHLKRKEAEVRLKLFNWDINEATKELMYQVKHLQVSKDSFVEEEDNFSDTSSLLNYVD